MVTKWDTLLFKLLILAIFSVYYLVLPAQHPLWGPEETRYAEIGREMLLSHNWQAPHLLGAALTREHLIRVWMTALGQMIFGHTPFGVRASSVLCVLLSAMLLYRLALRMWNDRQTAMMGAVIFLTSLLVYQRSCYASLDSMVTLGLVASMSGCWKALSAGSLSKKFVAGGLAALAGILVCMVSGAVSAVVPLLALLPWCVCQRRLNGHAVLALSIAACALTFWGLAGYLASSPRTLMPSGASASTDFVPLWGTALLIIGGSLPWAALLPGACCTAWQERHLHASGLYLLSWGLGSLLTATFLSAELTTSALACSAPLALLIARYAVRLSVKAPRKLRINGWANLGLGLLGAAAAGAYLFPLNLSEAHVYSVREAGKVMLMVTALLGWSMTGAIALLPSSRGWMVAACCPLALVLIAEPALPDGLAYVRQPHRFIAQIRAPLRQSRFILTEDAGMAPGLAWELQRSDILIYGNTAIPAPGAQRVPAADFPRWLLEHRQLGNVAVLMTAPARAPEGGRLPLPESDSRFQLGEQVAYFYRHIPGDAVLAEPGYPNSDVHALQQVSAQRCSLTGSLRGQNLPDCMSAQAGRGMITSSRVQCDSL